jgi:hypothetical protein
MYQACREACERQEFEALRRAPRPILTRNRVTRFFGKYLPITPQVPKIPTALYKLLPLIGSIPGIHSCIYLPTCAEFLYLIYLLVNLFILFLCTYISIVLNKFIYLFYIKIIHIVTCMRLCVVYSCSIRK